jgi:lipoate-protein ligase A
VILWLDGTHVPAENMRRDRALLAAAERGAEPVLRLFLFSPPGITLGMSQVPERELDLERCVADGIPWTNRPTGGGAIFHAEEWTWALAAPRDDPEWGGGPRDAYARASRLIVGSLRRLGVPASLVARGGPASPRSRAPGPAAPCFASAARHEVVLDGRKLVGSAQRRTARGLLQEGSVLLGDGHLRLADYLRLPPAERDRARAALAGSTAPAGPWLSDSAALVRWAAALVAELGTRARRVDGAQGLHLLTASAPDSYTPAVR